jgi:hypothetical protein
MKFSKIYISFLALISIQYSAISNNLTNNFSNSLKDLPCLISQNEDEEIISETNLISIIGRKEDFINFSFTKKVKYLVKNQINSQKLASFVLPETFDPTYISHSPEVRNYTYVLSNLKVNYFNATIKNKNNEITEAKVVKTIQDVKMVIVMKFKI